MKDNRMLISGSPQIHAKGSTRSIMLWVLVALAPAAVWSIFLFGMRSLVLILVATAACVITEFILNKLFGRENTLADLSSVVTGVLIAFNMPPMVPLFIPIVASIFAIAVVKWSFGGLGSNWMNPALAGRIFVFFSWGPAMTRWTLPRFGSFVTPDAIGTATPLGTVKMGLSKLNEGIDGPMQLLESIGTPFTYLDLFFGRTSGSLGEMSAFLIIIGGILLLFLRIVNWGIPFAFTASFVILMWAFDGLQYGGGLFSGDALFHILSGGFMLGAWFMATDMVTSPLTASGQLLFGLGCGVLTFVIRRYGSLPEGVSLAIIFMNIFTPLIDRFTQPQRYGASL